MRQTFPENRDERRLTAAIRLEILRLVHWNHLTFDTMAAQPIATVPLPGLHDDARVGVSARTNGK